MANTRNETHEPSDRPKDSAERDFGEIVQETDTGIRAAAASARVSAAPTTTATGRTSERVDSRGPAAAGRLRRALRGFLGLLEGPLLSRLFLFERAAARKRRTNLRLLDPLGRFLRFAHRTVVRAARRERGAYGRDLRETRQSFVSST